MSIDNHYEEIEDKMDEIEECLQKKKQTWWLFKGIWKDLYKAWEWIEVYDKIDNVFNNWNWKRKIVLIIISFVMAWVIGLLSELLIGLTTGTLTESPTFIYAIPLFYFSCLIGPIFLLHCIYKRIIYYKGTYSK